MKIFLLFAAFSFASSTFATDVFQWLDSEGKRHYSDRPHQNAERVKIHPGYSYHKVKKVFDGDTLQLLNGQKVRFLGVNTPEVEGRFKSAEPGGEEAKKWLSENLKNIKIRFEKDVEKKDKYGRLLAHVFTEEGEHLNLELVKRGLATVNIHPPNLKYTKELLALQDNAENAGLGLWGNQHYAVQPYVEVQRAGHKGWKRVTGRVNDIKRTRKNIYLQFSDDFSIKIKARFKDFFPDLEIYRGRKIEVRGWLSKSKNRFTISIKHPGSIKLLPS